MCRLGIWFDTYIPVRMYSSLIGVVEGMYRCSGAVWSTDESALHTNPKNGSETSRRKLAKRWQERDEKTIVENDEKSVF